jgi:hypothetical protein
MRDVCPRKAMQADGDISLGYRGIGDIYVWAASWVEAVDVYRGCANQGPTSINFRVPAD